MVETSYIFDDFWNIFSLPSNHILYGSDFVAICKKLNIDLTPTQQQLLSEIIFTFDQWMNLQENESIIQAMDTWKKLHSHYWNGIQRDIIETNKDTLCIYQWRLPRYLGYIKPYIYAT